jgi:hypothetical protein
MPDLMLTITIVWSIISTILLIYLQFFRPRELDKTEIMIDRLKDQLKFYSPLVNCFERPDYRMKRLTDPKGVVLEIIEKENIEKNYKIMAERDLKRLLQQIISGDLGGWNTWLDIHDEFRKLVSDDFTTLQEKYYALFQE